MASTSPEDLAVFNDDVVPAMREVFLSTLQARIDRGIERIAKEREAAFAEQEKRLKEQKDALEAREAEVTRMQEALKAEREAFEEEKSRMAEGKVGNDVLTLNIGGEKRVSVQRSTLCLIEPSMLASSFSGRWDDSLARDQDGNVFIDVDPDLFMPLLTYLRAKRMEDVAAPVKPPDVPGREAEFDTMLKFYGIECIRAVFRFTFDVAAVGGVRIAPGGTSATRTSYPHWKRALTSTVIDRTDLKQPLAVKFRVTQFTHFTSDAERQEADGRSAINGPSIGVAVVGFSRKSDDNDNRKPDGVWSYRASDGVVLAPNGGDIVGPKERAAAELGEVLSFVINPDGTARLWKGKKDCGIIFRNLPMKVTPVVEMNKTGQTVEIVH